VEDFGGVLCVYPGGGCFWTVFTVLFGGERKDERQTKKHTFLGSVMLNKFELFSVPVPVPVQTGQLAPKWPFWMLSKI
jgi:hypothetical protein